ncbi:uncharacterized protein LOC116430295 isoform X6 [Nomia melanderi]|uniref:uncharacterized protein LOC116430295 isoform X6 n=1 Tax=Nomia melanderi TaxID=2448451 RepID=UPI0013041ECB|nr:nucleus accumbens-associated protein 1 isoform X4 [Nomia melanderi]
MHEGQKYFKNKAVGIGRLVWQWTLRVGWRCNGKKFAKGSGLEIDKMDQQYCLRWNNHPANLTDVLSSLLAREALCDVTLACVGDTFKAHQTILSACSPYFESIFLQNTHPHPIIFLKDVNDTEMKALLHFMYKGEVNVSQHLLPMFLKTAEALQIRGLTDNSVNNKAEEKSPSPEPETQTGVRHTDSPNLQPLPEKRKRKASGSYDVSLSGPPSERFMSDSQASSQCSYKSSPPVIPKLNNALGGEMEDGGRPMSPSSQPQPSIKQELDHHLPDFHDNISLPGHPVGLLAEEGGATTGALSDGVSGIESSEHHNPPEMLDGLDGEKVIDGLLKDDKEESAGGMGTSKQRVESRHSLKKYEGSARESRKRCSPCYQEIRSTYGPDRARAKAKRVRTYCNDCSGLPAMCLDCFNKIHK